MKKEELLRIFKDNDFVHTSGTAEELKVAEYLRAECEKMGVGAVIEPFPVSMGEMEEAKVFADGKEIPCTGFFCCGSGEAEGELYYMPSVDKVSLAGARDKIVLLDTGGVGTFAYKDLMEAGVKAILFRYGNLFYPNEDIDVRDLRGYVVGEERKVLCAMINAKTAVELVNNGVKRVKIVIKQREYEGESRNVVAEIKGKREEYIVLSAHLDSTALSHGSYDNLSGCVGLLGIMDKLKDAELNYGLRFVFCGSEERGLLGSKAYVKAHEEELPKIALNINLDMIGTILGKFISCVSAEEALAHYVSYMGAEIGFPISVKTGVYSSDSTPFADNGVPALSFARMGGGDVAPIHCRYDTVDLLSMDRMEGDIAFISEFTRRMACSAVCPVSRDIPEKVKKELDEYMGRKRKE
ncbi:MAG: Zn-dependent exopeptidase M28 [Clostridiales bacterium]|nr:Zn-dependent exopeptidase M28 [Clostridiales bacterium]